MSIRIKTTGKNRMGDSSTARDFMKSQDMASHHGLSNESRYNKTGWSSSQGTAHGTYHMANHPNLYEIQRSNNFEFVVGFDRNMLRYQLYEYYHMEEYRQLFQDIAVKQQIEGNFLDIEEALQNAVLYGLINSFNSQPSGNKRLIFIDKEQCEEILHSYSDDYVNKMDCLTDLYLEDLLLNKEKIKNISK